MSKVDFITITDHYEGQRIDNFLMRELKNVPKSLVYRIIRKGEVRVNKKRIKQTYKLETGDVVRIPPVRYDDTEKVISVSKHQAESLKSRILFEDDRILIVKKPYGLAVHGGSGIHAGLIEKLRVIYPEHQYLELAHRLDKETSGCIVIAKKASALRKCHQLFRDKEVEKTYHALVVGKWPRHLKEVDEPLLKKHLKSGERIIRVDKTGKPSLTKFRVLKRFKEATLIEAKPVTGRTHQIRVHTASVGCPIVGDEKYTDKEKNQHFAKNFGLKRMYLHAHQIEFLLDEDEINVRAEYDWGLEGLA